MAGRDTVRGYRRMVSGMVARMVARMDIGNGILDTRSPKVILIRALESRILGIGYSEIEESRIVYLWR